MLERVYLSKSRSYVPAGRDDVRGIFLDANESYANWLKIDWKKIQHLNRYGDSSCKVLRQKLCKAYVRGFLVQNIFIGSGNIEILELIMRSFVEPDEFVMTLNPAYSLYKISSQLHGLRIKEIPFQKNNFGFPLAEIKKHVQGVKALILCSPNNPTGQLIAPDDLKEILSFYKGIVVIDETYIEYAGLQHSLLQFARKNNVIVLRSFSKAWGLAGIRVGYAIAHPNIISVLEKVKNPYNVSKISQQIALQALSQIPLLLQHVAETNQIKKKLLRHLRNMQFQAIDTSANFLLIQHQKAKEIYENLRKKHISIRYQQDAYGMGHLLRVTIGAQKEINMFIAELHRIKKRIDAIS